MLPDPESTTIADILKEQGYNTAAIGKWHLGWDWHRTNGEIDFTKPVKNGPDINGFDQYYGHCGSLDMPPYVYVQDEMVTAVPDQHTPGTVGKAFWREGPIAPDFKHEEVLTRLTRRAVDDIERMAKDGSPFFLYFPLPAPHTPILPAAQYQGKSGTNEYGDFCLQVDDVVGL